LRPPLAGALVKWQASRTAAYRQWPLGRTGAGLLRPLSPLSPLSRLSLPCHRPLSVDPGTGAGPHRHNGANRAPCRLPNQRSDPGAPTRQIAQPVQIAQNVQTPSPPVTVETPAPLAPAVAPEPPAPPAAKRGRAAHPPPPQVTLAAGTLITVRTVNAIQRTQSERRYFHRYVGSAAGRRRLCDCGTRRAP
jgi:hypothetical protein